MRGPARLRLGILVTVLLVSSGDRVEAGVSTSAHRTLARFHDPVILQTSRLDMLVDRRTSKLRLYSAHSGVLEPIPFQFDARDDDGDVVFSGKASARAQMFDGNDEFVFMAKDSGDRVEVAALPIQSDAGLEIEVTDPATGEQGWVYLLHFAENPPARSPVAYATFDSETSRARASYYVIDYSPGRNFFTGMRILPAAGGTGENLLDRMKIRIRPTFSLLVTRWSPLFTEEDFSTEIDGVKNGPVRAIRRVRNRLDLGRFFPKGPVATVYTYYYFSSFTTPAIFSFPWLVAKSMRDFRFTGVSDFRESALGMTYWDEANPEGIRLTGGNRLAVETNQDHDWWALSGRGRHVSPRFHHSRRVAGSGYRPRHGDSGR